MKNETNLLQSNRTEKVGNFLSPISARAIFGSAKGGYSSFSFIDRRDIYTTRIDLRTFDHDKYSYRLNLKIKD